MAVTVVLELLEALREREGLVPCWGERGLLHTGLEALARELELHVRVGRAGREGEGEGEGGDEGG